MSSDHGRLVGQRLAPAEAMEVHRRRRGDAVQPRAQVVGVPQLRVRPQRAQQRVLQDVLAVIVARELAGVDEQLVAVGLDERPERGKRHAHLTRAAPGT